MFCESCEFLRNRYHPGEAYVAHKESPVVSVVDLRERTQIGTVPAPEGDALLGVRIRKSVEASQGLQTVTYVDFQLHVIPEPATGALLLVGIAGLAASRRRPVPAARALASRERLS